MKKLNLTTEIQDWFYGAVFQLVIQDEDTVYLSGKSWLKPTFVTLTNRSNPVYILFEGEPLAAIVLMDNIYYIYIELTSSQSAQHIYQALPELNVALPASYTWAEEYIHLTLGPPTNA